MGATSLPFTREMVVVHKMFRREFGNGSAWVRRVAAGDTAQAQRVTAHMEVTFDALHHHHEAEDIHLWPLLRQRAADHGALLDDMEHQHEGIDPALAKARDAGSAWAATADEASREAFAAALDEMVGPLMAHLDQEEAEILPLAQRLLSEDEWSKLGEHAVAAAPKKALLRGFGGILEDATPEERTMMTSVLPPPVRLMYRFWGRGAYIRDATAVRGVAPSGL